MEMKGYKHVTNDFGFEDGGIEVDSYWRYQLVFRSLLLFFLFSYLIVFEILDNIVFIGLSVNIH